MGITKELTEDLFRIKTLDRKDREQLQTLIIDYFAAAFAGYRQNRAFNGTLEKVVYAQGGAEECTVFLQERKYPARIAAFMNAAYGHGAELDDGNKKAAGHAGVHIIPSVFAVAEKTGSTNEDVLTALATGYEGFIRISSAAQPGQVQRGFHSTGMAGTLACAAACARLYRLDARGIENAVALATTMTGGLLSYGDSRPAIKPLNPGKAAENGVFAAMLASEGMQGPAEALEGPNGWFHAVTDHVNTDMLWGSADGHLLLHDCYFKLFPSCRHTHCAIEAALKLYERVRADQAERIDIHIYPNAIKLAGQIRFPQCPDETKFSIPYTFACAFLRGSYGVSDMGTLRLSKEVADLIGKIRLIPDETMEDRSRGIRGARVTVETYDRRIFEETVLIPKGDPERPLSRADIINKLKVCANGQEEDGRLDSLIDAVGNISGDAKFINPMALLRKR